MTRKKPRLRPVNREMLETVAQIVGPHSAAAAALATAAAHDGPVRFYTSEDDTFVVEKLPKEPLT